MSALDFTPSTEVKALQCAVLLALLKQGPVPTLQARAVGIMSAANRVREASLTGCPIKTERRLSADKHGGVTRCAWYVLKGGAH